MSDRHPLDNPDRCGCIGYKPQDPGALTPCVNCGHDGELHGLYACFAFVAPSSPVGPHREPEQRES